MPSRLLSCLALLGLALPARASTPTNGWVVWASDRMDSRHEIYLMKSDGTGVTRLTTQGGKFPTFSPDGFWVSYHRETPDEAWIIHPDGKGETKLGPGKPVFWLYDNSGLAVQDGDDVFLYDPTTLAKKKLWSKTDFSRIASSSYTLFEVAGLTADKRWLVVATDFYKLGATGDNGTFKHGWGPQLLDLQDTSKIYFVGEGCEGTTSPTGSSIYHMNGELFPETRIYTMDVNDILTRSSYKAELDFTNTDWGHEYFPRVSTDGTWLTYGASTGCHDHETCDYEIHVHKLGVSNDRTRITTDSGNDQWPHMFVGTLPQCVDTADCDDSDPCTTDSCSAGQCSHTAVSGCCVDAGDCDDGNDCSTDTCVSNTCVFNQVAGCCASDSDCTDNNPCTTDTCETTTGTCSNAATAGCCAFDVDCDDGDSCTVDSCDLSSNTCVHQGSCGDGGPDLGQVSEAGAVTDAGIGAESSSLTTGKLVGGCDVGRGGGSSLVLLLALFLPLLVRRR